MPDDHPPINPDRHCDWCRSMIPGDTPALWSWLDHRRYVGPACSEACLAHLKAAAADSGQKVKSLPLS